MCTTYDSDQTLKHRLPYADGDVEFLGTVMHLVLSPKDVNLCENVYMEFAFLVLFSRSESVLVP